MKTLILTSSMALVSGLMVYPVQAQDAGVKNLMTSSFQSIGIASVDRLDQDETQKACSQLKNGKPQIDSKLQSQIEKNNLKTVVYPADANYLGQWSRKVAKAPRGRTKATMSMAGAATTATKWIKKKSLTATSDPACTTTAN